jgi:hypothetical protein
MKQEIYELFQQYVATWREELKNARAFIKTARDQFPQFPAQSAERPILSDALAYLDLAEYTVNTAEMHFANLHLEDMAGISAEAIAQFIGLANQQASRAEKMANEVIEMEKLLNETLPMGAVRSDALFLGTFFVNACRMTLDQMKTTVKLY